MTKELPPIPVEAYDGEKQVITVSFEKHQHQFLRKSSTIVGCKLCSNEWIDSGKIWPL